MSFQTYADLENAVRDWLNREDQSVINRTPDFITFAENRMFRDLRTRFNEKTVIFDSQELDNTKGVKLPVDFKEVKTFQYDDRFLQRKSDQWFFSQEANAAAGVPDYFARIGDELRIWRQADSNADAVLWYYYQPKALSEELNDFYDRFPELYLFGALLEAKPYLKATDAADIATWQAKYNETFEAIMDDSWEAEYAGSTVQVVNAYDDTTGRGFRGYGGF